VAYEADGIMIFIHEDVLAETSVPGSIPFHFGAWGWCSLTLVAGEGAPD
jgi:hypothetical protein